MALSYPLYSASEMFKIGTVVAQVKNHWRVRMNGVLIEANLAASCLVGPQKDSEVILVFVKDQYYILSVLNHPSPVLEIEAKTIKLKAQVLIEKIETLRYLEAKVITEKAEVILKQADKILIN
jgi:hypothetical protein